MNDETRSTQSLPQRDASENENLKWLTGSLQQLAEQKQISRQQPKLITKPYVAQNWPDRPYIPTSEELANQLQLVQQKLASRRELNQAQALLNCGRKSA